MDIYSIGGGEIVYEVLSAVVRCLHGDNGSLLQGSIRIGMIVGAFMLYMSVITNNWAEIVKTWMAPIAFIMYTFFLPTTTVWVHDDISKFHKKLDNVPYGLGMFASYSSAAGKYITEKTEQNFSAPDDLRYHKTGMMFGADILEKAKTFKITNTNFKENMRNFVGQCIKYDIMLNNKYTFDTLKNSPDIWELVTSEGTPSVNRGIFWIPLEGGRSEYVTCAQAIGKFNAAWKAEIEKTTSNLGLKMFSGRAIGHSTPDGKFVVSQQLAATLKREILKNIKSTYSYFGELQQSSEELMKQNMMVNAIEDAAAHNSHLSGNSLAFAEAKALFQQRSTYETLGRMASKVLPIMKAVLEALVYACFIFIIPLCMIPSGYKFLINWCGTLIWLQAWAPMYAVLNYVMSVAARASTLAEIGLSGGITIANMTGVSEANADMRTLAGYLALSIPFICIAIVNGVGTFVNLAGQLTGVTTQAGSSAAAEIAGGNFSFGNVSVGNQQMGNVSQLQRNFSSSLSGADHMLMNGVEQIKYNTDRSHIFNSHYSTGKVDGSFDTGDAVSQGMALQNAESIQKSEETAFAASESIRESDLIDFGHQISNTNANTESSSAVITASHDERFQKALRVLEGYGNSGNYSHGNNSTIGGSGGGSFGWGRGSKGGSAANTGGNKDGAPTAGASISAALSTNTNASASNMQNLSESVQTQDDMSYQEAQAVMENYARQIANSETDSAAKSLAVKCVQNIENSKAISARKSIADQHVDSLTKSYSRSLNSSFSVRDKGTRDDVAEEILKRNKNISPEEAYRQIDRNTPAAQEALRIVKDQRMHSVPKTTVAYNRGFAAAEKDKIKNEFTGHKQEFETQTGVKEKTANLSKELGDMSYKPNDEVKNNVNDQIIQVKNQDIAEEKSNIEEKMKKIETVVDEEAVKGTVRRVVGQAVDNAFNLNFLSKDKEINVKKP